MLADRVLLQPEFGHQLDHNRHPPLTGKFIIQKPLQMLHMLRTPNRRINMRLAS